MRMLPRFWKTLDELPGAATDARDWKARLGDENDAASRFLRRTGDLAVSVDCPSPGGGGCPRRVVKLRNGGFRGVCSSASGRCEPIDLTRDDVAIMVLDQKRLAGDLASALQLAPAKARPPSQRVVHLGDFAIAAGVSAPVLLAVPGPHDPLSEDELREAGVALPGAILMPQPGSLPSALRARLINDGNLLLDLAATTCIDANHRLTLVQKPEVLFDSLRQALLTRLDGDSRVSRLRLPSGTTWEQVTIALISAETLTCSAPGWSPRQLDPDQLGMRNAKNHKPTLAWTVLMGLAIKGRVTANGKLPDKNQIQKQKQALTANLRTAFGIDGDPLRWDASQQAYVPRFVIRDDRPLAEREPDRRRR